nr:RNA-directed DNA polymerase, eukaryota, reverse transcriptase zinc-binding domain protein [Tanacetum cinerariifolium]
RFKKKIQDLKVRIRAWIKDKRSSVSGDKDSIKKEISDIDRLLDGGDISDSNLLRRSELHRNLYTINQMESKEYLQKSKIKWTIEGDENSKFFHGLINKKRSQLAIRGVFTGSFPNGCNSSFVALIPKITDAKFVNDFRPISLIGSVYKVVTKDYLLDVLEAFWFGNIWCKWIRGTFSSAKALVLVNGSPTIKFLFHCGLKQGDPLSPYLFILIMESLNMSFTRAIDEGLKINIQKSQVLGVGVPSSIVMQATSSIGCGVLHKQFLYLGVMVGECGRLTLLKAVLGASPLYNMSIFKVPKGILNSMEAIRSKFFNGMKPSTKKITWAAWNKVLASN